jgi:hypothetical protein
MLVVNRPKAVIGKQQIGPNHPTAVHIRSVGIVARHVERVYPRCIATERSLNVSGVVKVNNPFLVLARKVWAKFWLKELPSGRSELGDYIRVYFDNREVRDLYAKQSSEASTDQLGAATKRAQARARL